MMITNVEGWDGGGVVVRGRSRARAQSQGNFAERNRRGERVLSVEGIGWADTRREAADMVDELNGWLADGRIGLFQVDDPDLGLRWARGKLSGATEVTWDGELDFEFAVDLECPDPRKYGERKILDTKVAQSNGGLRFDLFTGSATAGITVGAATRILSIGDSTTLGYGSGSVDNSYPYQLRDLIAAKRPAVNGMLVPPNNNIVNDTRWNPGTGTGAWTISNSNGWGNMSSYRGSGTTNQNLTVTPGRSFDTVDLMFIVSPGNTNAKVYAGKTPSTTTLVGELIGIGPAGVKKTTLSVPPGTTSVTITPTGGNFWLQGVHPRNMGEARVSISNAGSSGSTTAQWTTGYYNSALAITAFDPDLTILSLGINDSGAAVTKDVYKANMRTLITAALGTGQLIVWTNPPSNEYNGRLVLQRQYREAILELRDELGFTVVDIFEKWGDYATANAAGWMSDSVHPSTAGYGIIAGEIAKVMEFDVQKGTSGVLDFGGDSTDNLGTITYDHRGTADTFQLFRVRGYTPGFTITELETGRRLEYKGEIPAFQDLYLNAFNGAVYLESPSANRLTSMTRVEWPSIPPKTRRTYRFDSPEGPNARLYMEVSPAWF